MFAAGISDPREAVNSKFVSVCVAERVAAAGTGYEIGRHSPNMPPQPPIDGVDILAFRRTQIPP
jgi:hypothetical protein